MTTVTYSLKITLVDQNGAPIIRCWGPCFDVIDGVPSSPGWHHYIISFDSSIPRVQMAMDRGGGPVLGGGVLDTQLGTGVVDGAGNFPFPVFSGGNNPQAMFATLEATSLNGFSPSPGILNIAPSPGPGFGVNVGVFEFNADLQNVTDFAYGYFGVSTTDTFFDLTASTRGIPNLNFFVTPGLSPVNFGAGGESITPLACRFMHTGDATNIGGITPDPWSPSITYHPGDYVTTQISGATLFWLAVPQTLDKQNPLGPNRDKPPDQWGRFIDGGRL